MTDVRITLTDARNMIPDFDGNPSDLDRFIGCCDVLFETAKEDAEKALFLSVLKTRLIGPAYELVKHSVHTDWDSLKVFLKEQFLDERPRVAVQAELQRLKQGFKESIGEFAQRLNRILAELNNVTCNNVTDSSAKKYLLEENELNAIRAFEDGLRSEQFKVIAKSKGETNLRRLITYASEHALRLEAQTKGCESSKSTQTCEICGKKGHSQNTCFRNKLIPSFRPPGPQIKREVHRLRCAYCHKPNHNQSECRTRIYDERTRRQGRHTLARYQQPSPPAPHQTHPTPARQVRWNTTTDENSENDITRMECDGTSTRVTKAVIHQTPNTYLSEYQ